MNWLLFFLALIASAVVRALVIAANSRRRGWRVGFHGRDGLNYDEFANGGWARIKIDGEMLVGPKPGHVIYFRSVDDWLEYPEWARHRRGSIVRRIIEVLPEPNFAYDGIEDILEVAGRQSNTTGIGFASLSDQQDR